MALAIDASSPAAANGLNAGGVTAKAWASTAFSPPAGSVIVASVSVDLDTGGTTCTSTITDSLGSHLTWTKIGELAPPSSTFGGYVAAYWAFTSAAQTSMTVTITTTRGVSTVNYYAEVGVQVFTGADTSAPVAAVATGSNTTTNPTNAAVTPTRTGSFVYMVGMDWNGGTAPTAGTSCTQSASYNPAGAYSASLLRNTTILPDTSAFTLSQNYEASPVVQYLAYEVRAPAGATAVRPGLPNRRFWRAAHRSANI